MALRVLCQVHVPQFPSKLAFQIGLLSLRTSIIDKVNDFEAVRNTRYELPSIFLPHLIGTADLSTDIFNPSIFFDVDEHWHKNHKQVHMLARVYNKQIHHRHRHVNDPRTHHVMNKTRPLKGKHSVF